MPLNYTPISWKNVDPQNRDQMKLFLLQLSDFLNSAFNPSFLSFALNGQGLLSISSLNVVSTSITASTNQSIACDNAVFVNVFLTFTAAITVTFTHLGLGAYVNLVAFNSTGGALVLKVAATNPSGTAFAGVQVMNSADAPVDLLGTGVSVPSGGQRGIIGNAILTTRFNGLML